MSKPYMISYDLNDPGQNYEDVTKEIESISAVSIELQKSFWLVRSTLSADEMTEALKKSMDKNDSLFICEIVNNYQGLDTKDNWKFIRESIFLKNKDS